MKGSINNCAAVARMLLVAPFMPTKLLASFALIAIFFSMVPNAQADFIISQDNVDSTADSATLYNRTDCATSTDGAKCRFQFFSMTSGVVLRSVEFSFDVQGGAGTAKACLYKENSFGNFDLHTQVACSTTDSVANTDHKQTFTFTTPYVVTQTGTFAVSIELQSGGDLLIKGNPFAPGIRSCYRMGSAPPVNCGTLLSLYWVLNADDNVVAAGDIQNPFAANQIGLTDFIASYPDHDTAVGACSNSTFQDYWECFWSYVQYFAIPTSAPIYNSLQKPYTMLQSRWPFGYVLQPIASYSAGIAQQETSCPFADLGGGTLLGTSLPDVPICDNLSDVKTAMEANTLVQGLLVTLIYLGFGFMVFGAARNFLHG